MGLEPGNGCLEQLAALGLGHHLPAFRSSSLEFSHGYQG